MVGLQGTLITGVVGLVLALGLAYKWKSEQVKVARLEGEIAQVHANNETLKAGLAEQTTAVKDMIGLMRTNQEQVNELSQQLDDARAATTEVRNLVNAIRTTEANRALEAPFKRGNAAHERFTDSLRRISATSGGASSDSDDTDAAGAGDSS